MKQCPQCRRSYDDSQNFCLMDGTPLAIEPEQETVVRQPPIAAPKKSRRLLWLGLAGLLAVSAMAAVAGFLIYNFAARDADTQAKSNRNTNASPVRTAPPTPKTTPTPTPANANANVRSTPEKSPADNTGAAANTNSGEEITPIDWSTTATGFKNEIGMTYKFQCPADGKEYAVWGSDIYTADSSICTAAVHAGLLTLAEGGVVTIEFRPGRLTYGSTTRNGIKSLTFGEYRLSYVVR